jgi:hypothetical protein
MGARSENKVGLGKKYIYRVNTKQQWIISRTITSAHTLRPCFFNIQFSIILSPLSASTMYFTL